MAAELVKWDPAAIKQKIAEGIRATYMSLVPDEVFQALIDEELKAFTVDKIVEEYRNGQRVPVVTEKSRLKQMIEAEVKEVFKAAVKEEITKPEYWSGGSFVDKHGYNRSKPGEAVKAILEGSASVFVEAIFGAVVQDAITVLRSGLSR